VSNPQKARGDRAELEAAALLSDLTGYACRRKLGAGRTNAAGGDTGDIDGIPGHAIQVANWKDTAAAAIQKPRGAQEQAENSLMPHAMTMIRFKGGTWRIVLTPEQWNAYLKKIYP
jgi:hypothetical protein